MHSMFVIKKKIIVPVLVFLAGMGILGATLYSISKSQQEQNQTTASLNAMTYAERMQSDIREGMAITGALEQILISEDGKIDKFFQVAEDMMTDAIQSIQIAPGGVVSEIYPEAGNEAGKIDLIHDEQRGTISRYARDNHVLVLQGPFPLKQGGSGMAVRKPVYLKGEDGQEAFWGFTIVIIRVPEIFAESVKALSDFGYEYRLLKTVSPWETEMEEVYRSGGTISQPVSYEFEMGGEQWKLEVMPKHGWSGSRYLYAVMVGGFLIVLLLTGLTGALLILDDHRKMLKKRSLTDALTGICNRHGFDEKVLLYLKQHPGSSCVGAQFDIDDFKCINDVYGHAAGDQALRNLAEEMRRFFPKNAVLGRTGGDEFCIFLPECTCEEIKETIEQFTKQKKTFLYDAAECPFTISLGYAQYPQDADTYAQLLHCADAALYEVKMRGKNGCLAYQMGGRLEIRTQLGFVLKDVSENLPGAFIIYKADRVEDEIFFANRELLHLTGCKDMEELLDYTQGSFRNLIRESERAGVEKSIWKQIGRGGFNDYVSFELKKKDGTYLPVLDHGRLVENGRYGKVFYVLLMDWNLLQKHYHSCR